MPEGPSLVVLKRSLLPFEGKIVTESGGYRNPFAEEISGKKLMSVSTYGKFFIFQFKDFFVTVHLGLFGSFLINDSKSVNASFSLHFGSDFINFYVVNVKLHQDKAEDYFNYSLDPFSDQFEVKQVLERLNSKKFADKLIGDVLMEQIVFPGVGNVIRNEVLFLSKIHPESIVSKIPEKKLHEMIDIISQFSKSSLKLIEQKVWKTSASVYRKEKFQDKKVEMFVSPKLKRKTFFIEDLQKRYL